MRISIALLCALLPAYCSGFGEAVFGVASASASPDGGLSLLESTPPAPPTSVPEPAAGALLISAAAGWALSRRGAQARAARTAALPEVRSAPYAEPTTYDSVKRCLDFTAALVVLPLLSPLMAIVAVIVKIDSPGPALFVQRRLGLGGRTFYMYKFRSMRLDAEATSGAVFAAPDDPRLTPLGAILRKYRLDELPQIFNIISGDMSFIGPRPERPEIAKELTKSLPRMPERLEVRPGVTGLAQVHVGYASCLREYRRKLALDLLYIQHRSLLLDLKIAIKTALVIITGDGAR